LKVSGGRDSEGHRLLVSELYTEERTSFEAEDEIVGGDALN
jgi:hypothetical protein